MATTGDPLVLKTQEWLNDTYRGVTGYGDPIPETGKTGWTTIYALTRALQIELGITATSNSFGPTTTTLFNARYPNGVTQQSLLDISEDNVYAIIQGALFCKGYSTGVMNITKHFYDGTGAAIKNLKRDAGINNTSSNVTLNVMKALLSMDAFVKVSGGDSKIREIQQYLNGNYEAYIGLKACDGLYGRGTNTALIYAIQAEEGLPTSVANGNFGPTTKNCCPTIPYQNVEKSYTGTVYNSTKISKFTKLMKMGLYVNEIGDGNFEGGIDSISIIQFQNRYAINITGTCNLATWLSIFTSSGDTARSVKACDTATLLTIAQAQTLYNNGYRYVGRYLSGTVGGTRSKALTRNELQIIFNAGLRVFPIYQDGATSIAYFNESKGESDATSAYNYALSLGIPTNTIIYFAVDCDPIETEISSNIIPYFRKVSEIMKNRLGNKYKIGIYGTRNVCSTIMDLNYAKNCFVSDMSTGFSGNLGFTIPNNWAFDQIATVTIGSGTGQIEIDKDGFSGLDTGFGAIDLPDPEEEPDYNESIGYDTFSPSGAVMINNSSKSYRVYSSKVDGLPYGRPGRDEVQEVGNDLGIMSAYYGGVQWCIDGDIVGEIKPGDFYIRFECRDHSFDNVPEYINRVVNHGDAAHKVLFRAQDGTVRYGYVQEYLTPDEVDNSDSRRADRVNYSFYKFDPVQNKIVENPEKEYTVKLPLQYREASPAGTVLGTLPMGARIKNAGKAGATYKDHMYFEKIFNIDTNQWEFIDKNLNQGVYVDLGMRYGVNGYSRSIW